jgi:hypothetical protein
MLKFSPGDAPLIREFNDLIFGKNMMDTASLKPQELTNIFDSLKILPAFLP